MTCIVRSNEMDCTPGLQKPLTQRKPGLGVVQQRKRVLQLWPFVRHAAQIHSSSHTYLLEEFNTCLVSLTNNMEFEPHQKDNLVKLSAATQPGQARWLWSCEQGWGEVTAALGNMTGRELQ
jgi:hypothetical protein